MYRIELIPKTSVMNDIIDNWTATGRADNVKDGQFVFEDVDYYCAHECGVLRIEKGEKTYFYNMLDFYRVKITNQEEKQGDLL